MEREILIFDESETVFLRRTIFGAGMDAHRVFVIWIHPLFGESLRLLLQDDDIEWVGSSSRNEGEFSDVQRVNPDTILIEEDDHGSIPSKVMNLMETSDANFRVFRLSLADNDLMIYHREKRTVMQVDDLLNLIREGE